MDSYLLPQQCCPPLRPSALSVLPQNVIPKLQLPLILQWKLDLLLQPHFGLSVRMRLTLPKSGNWESSETPATLELNNRGQNTLPWSVLYTVGKVLKCRCLQWPRMSHLDICSPSYGQKKGWEWNRPLSDVCRRSATRHWKALEESYNFGSDLTPIGGRSWEIWVPKVPGVQPGTVSGLLLGSLGKKCHSDVAPAE
jgi:hypothetical protein